MEQPKAREGLCITTRNRQTFTEEMVLWVPKSLLELGWHLLSSTKISKMWHQLCSEMEHPTKASSSNPPIWPNSWICLPCSSAKTTFMVWEHQLSDPLWTLCSTQEVIESQVFEQMETIFFKSEKSWDSPRSMQLKMDPCSYNLWLIAITATLCQILEPPTELETKSNLIERQQTPLSSWGWS